MPPEKNNTKKTQILQLATSLNNKLAVRSIAASSRVVKEKIGDSFVYAPLGRELSYFKRWGAKIIKEVKIKDINNSKAVIKRLKTIINEHDIKIIHSHDFNSLKIAQALQKLLDVRVLYTKTEDFLENSLFKFLNDAVFGEPLIHHNTIVPTKLTYNKLLTKYARKGAVLNLIPIPVDFSVYSENKVSQERTISLTRSWGMLEKPRFIVLAKPYFNSKQWQNQIIELSSVCHQLPENIKPYIVVLRDEQNNKALKEFENRVYENQNDVLCLAQPVSDIEAALKISSIYLDLTPNTPYYPLEALNAQAMGNAVISWKNDISIDFTPKEFHSLLVEKNNLKLVAENLKQLLTISEHQRDFAGRTCRNFVLNNFNMQNTEDLLVDAYSSLYYKQAG